MESRLSTDLPTISREYKGSDRNGFVFGWTPQAEVWNGCFAIISVLANLLWHLVGYSLVRDISSLISY
ncbi:high light inducible protein [Nostoc sp. CENA67]|uniref:High light inducible protein n=1 Tax=Amazonocrinis nigriterrae CENA67 TaxID=2794033 RepID=A0A8J7HMX5_9NOST|nr:high light inducible protein [Amazonocrinis nigriterrae]MBH8561330.1 high light inducible protein [Amazonocrinis nigriterrae CENA67]